MPKPPFKPVVGSRCTDLGAGTLREESLPTPDGGVYVHIPFCSAICPYCDFAVRKDDTVLRQRYVQHLLRETQLWSKPDAVLDSLYLGGGTPSALSEEQLSRLSTALEEHLPLSSRASRTLEANPEDVTRDSVTLWRDLGFSGVSLGVQSFDDDALKFLGRRHRGRAARQAVDRVLGEGFAWVSVDLIYGLPGQSLEDWRRKLRSAARLGVPHLSCYELTVHEGTPFHRWQQRGSLELPDEERRAAFFFATHGLLSELGYEGYEVSNFALSSRYRSHHNSKYWRQAPYLGLGMGAHSFDGRRRWWNERRLDGYGEKLTRGALPVAGVETLDSERLVLEALILGLRTVEGIDLESLSYRYGHDLAQLRQAEIERSVAAGLLVEQEGFLRPTLRGRAVAESLALELSP